MNKIENMIAFLKIIFVKKLSQLLSVLKISFILYLIDSSFNDIKILI